MRRFDNYEVKRGDDLGDPEFWNKRLEDIDIRIHAREQDADKIQAAIDSLVSVGIQRLNETFTPLIQQASQQVQELSAYINTVTETVQQVLDGGIDDGTF